MKAKTFISFFALMLYAILACASIDGNAIIIFFIIFGGLFALLLVIGIKATKEENEKEKKEKIALEERKKREKEQYEMDCAKLIEQKGNPDKTIILKETDLNSEIRVYVSAKKIVILGKEYEFDDIISCDYTDSPRTIKGQITAETKSKTGSTVGRAIVGDLVAGPAGAIIGGTTSKKSTVFHQEDDTIEHNFTVYINVNSISNPVISINTGDNSDLTNEICGLIKVIISRK